VVFERILCGVDGRPESVEAVRQVALLAPPGSVLLLAGVTQPIGAVPSGFGAVAAPLLGTKRELEEALEHAAAEIPGMMHEVEVRALQGAVIPTLLRAAEHEGATLVAVGIHGRSRMAGIALGSVTTAMLHDAPASIYVARRRGPEPWPRSIVVAVDGSAPALAAAEAARELAGRLDVELRGVCASGGKDVDRATARAQLGGAPLVEDVRHPVKAITDADAGLIVIGSRGLHGVHSLGSVSERVAHQARSSVLVVRTSAC
jgi:nucleotide-binding universal stress UspA family protein